MRRDARTGGRKELAAAAILFLAAGCSAVRREATAERTGLPVLDPIECARLIPERTYALAAETPPYMRREADDPRPYLSGVQLTYLAYGYACVYAVGENLEDRDATNGDVAMLLEARGPGLDVAEKRYPYERYFFDKFFISGPGRVKVTLTLVHDRTGEVFDRRNFEAEIGPAMRAEVEEAGWGEDGKAQAKVRIRVAADPAHYADKCRVEAALLETAGPGADRGRLLGRWKLNVEPQDDAVFLFDLKRSARGSPAGGRGGSAGPVWPAHYALRLRFIDGSRLVESIVRRFSLGPRDCGQKLAPETAAPDRSGSAPAVEAH